MRAHIFINGPAFNSDLYRKLHNAGQPDLVIGVDGGTAHCCQCGVRPDIIIGDLDSIPASTLNTCQEDSLEIIQHPTRKDATDLELALDLALERGVDCLDIFAALGGRWDMSIGNILTAAADKYKPLKVCLYSGTTQAAILHAGTTRTFHGSPGQVFSILPLAGTVTKVSLQGCEYPLHNRDIPFGSSLGMSNVYSSEKVSIFFTAGTLIYMTEILHHSH